MVFGDFGHFEKEVFSNQSTHKKQDSVNHFQKFTKTKKLEPRLFEICI